MARDVALFESLTPDTPPLLHFYAWKGPCVTLGHFLDPEQLLNLEAMEPLGIDWAKRPTGGGAVIHTCDLSFSLILPKSHSLAQHAGIESYRLIHGAVQRACASCCPEAELLNTALALSSDRSTAASQRDFCMAKPTRYDILFGGKKIGGGAQRRSQRGLLHQMTLVLRPPENALLRQILKNPTAHIAAMERTSGALCTNRYCNSAALRSLLIEAIRREFS